jgi:hypothetical protein
MSDADCPYGSDNGNSPLRPTERQHHGGQWFVFEYRDGDSSRRVPPSLLPGLDVAREEAIRSAADLLPDLDKALSPSAWVVRVYDDHGALLFTISKAEGEAVQRDVPS